MATDTLPHAAGIIGAAVPRIDGPLKTTGTARYAVDHDFPGLVHAVPVQSTIASGRIRTLDASAAEKMPGVLLVFHHRNMEKVYRLFPHQDDATTSEARPPFEDSRFGQPINGNFADYLVATCADLPDLEVTFLDYPDLIVNEYGARGVGEIGMAGVAPAITAAVYHATGVRVRELPVSIEHLLQSKILET
jgi:CO/xanthine dehydrogenase Mo-binding subunit